MKQVNKIYLASFLKNQTYFVPIIIVFFQDLGLNYQDIFWIFTAGAVFSFLIEIPTGIFADLYGKRRSVILSKFIIFLAFVAFGLAGNFIGLLVANLLYELGKSFRSGTETAYVYDYLDENPDEPRYTKVKANQKFYARISESLGTALGGFVAVSMGFNFVFFLAAIPAFLNFLQTLTWSRIKENSQKHSVQTSLNFAKESVNEVFRSRMLFKLVMNIMIFTTVFFALDKFVQPYMVSADIPLAMFGLIYSGFLLLVAFLARYAGDLEERFGNEKVFNYLTLLAVLPLAFLGFGFVSWLGVGLFFFVLLVQNVRSPIENSLFHEHVASRNRATMGSILELFKTSSKLVVLPITGYIADAFSMATAILVLGIVVLINGVLFWLRNK